MPLPKQTNTPIHTWFKTRWHVNLNTDRQMHVRKGKFMTHEWAGSFSFSPRWLLAATASRGGLLGRRGIFRWSLALFQNVTAGTSAHQAGGPRSLCRFTWETLLRKGLQDKLKGTLVQTKEVTEHVTDSDHINCLMKMNLWPTSRPTLFPTTAEGLHHLSNRKWLFFIVPLAQGSVKQWPCPSADMRTLLRRVLQVYPLWNRTQRQRAKDNGTQGTFK